MKPPIHRRQFYLSGTCQSRILGLSVFHQGIVFVVLAGALFFPLMITLKASPLDSPESQSVATQFLILHERIWPALPLALLVVGIHSLFFSHRIAGPLFRFSKVFRAVSAGDLTVPVKIRKHDYLHGEAMELSTMLDRLREKIAQIDGAAEQMKPAVENLQSALRTGGNADAARLCAVLMERYATLEQALQQFRTTPTGSGARG